MSLVSAKRTRSDNFEPEDVELLVELVNDYTKDIDHAKLDIKQTGWDTIHKKFNDAAKTPRDLSALKMKVKNIKAQSKRTKLEFVDTEVVEGGAESDNGEDETHFNVLSGKRKRCKRFSKNDCDLLVELFEKYCTGLDSSSSAPSVKRRHDAWDNLTHEFNARQTNDIIRDQGELKIKIKNLKAMKIKSEPSDSNNSTVFDSSESRDPCSSTPNVKTIIHNQVLAKQSPPHHQVPLRIIASHSNANLKANDDAQQPGDGFYDEFEVEYIRQPQQRSPKHMTELPSPSEDSKEIERIRKENLLIKNSVLKKKERLLELQIAIAERNLRRQL